MKTTKACGCDTTIPEEPCTVCEMPLCYECDFFQSCPECNAATCPDCAEDNGNLCGFCSEPLDREDED